MNADSPAQADLVEQVLSLFAQEARIERGRLQMDARTDELDIESLDLAVALFEIEERFGVEFAEPVPGMPPPTVGELVQQVLTLQGQRLAATGRA